MTRRAFSVGVTRRAKGEPDENPATGIPAGYAGYYWYTEYEGDRVVQSIWTARINPQGMIEEREEDADEWRAVGPADPATMLLMLHPETRDQAELAQAVPLLSIRAGVKGVNLVHVFERGDSPFLFVEWWEGKKRIKKNAKEAFGPRLPARQLTNPSELLCPCLTTCRVGVCCRHVAKSLL